MLARAALAVVLALSLAPDATACTCLCGGSSPETKKKLVDAADYVISGRVLSVELKRMMHFDMFLQMQIARIHVLKASKGEPPETMVVYSPAAGPACGVGFVPGTVLSLLAYREEDGNLHTSQCSDMCGRAAGVFDEVE